jgi:hypothetical protein
MCLLEVKALTQLSWFLVGPARTAGRREAKKRSLEEGAIVRLAMVTMGKKQEIWRRGGDTVYNLHW